MKGMPVQIGPYQVDREIGRGGMGVVYLARDERLDRQVAIKCLPDEFGTDEERLDRFNREARLLASLNHPNIATVHGLEEVDGKNYLVLEYINGDSLTEHLRRHGRSSLKCLGVASKIADALAAAHARGVAHRDIKPDNVRLTRDGHVKVLDFGLACTVSQNVSGGTDATTVARDTRPGAVMGTPGYMAPEQARGQPADARSDIFAFGCLLYEMLTGCAAFARDTVADSLAATLTEDVEPPSRITTGIRAEVDGIVMRCLEKRPDDRFQSARDLAFSLRTAVGGQDPSTGAGTPLPVDSRRPRPDVTSDAPRAVAVMPFEVLTGTEEDEFLRLALAQAVSHGLSEHSSLSVRPTSTVKRYLECDTDPHEAARELNVSVLVEGTIQRLGPRLRVQVQAWDASSRTTIFSRKIDGAMDDLFRLQDLLTNTVGRGIGVGSSPELAEQPPTKSAQAYEFFLRGSDRMLSFSSEDTRIAIDMFRSAVRLDPTFANGWARLAAALVAMDALFERNHRLAEEAARSIDHALRLDPTNGEALCARGRMLWSHHHGFQHAKALRDLGVACRCHSCEDDAALWRAVVMAHVGLHREAIELARERLVVEPHNLLLQLVLGETLIWDGQVEEGRYIFSKLVKKNPLWNFSHLFAPIAHLYDDDLLAAEHAVVAGRNVFGNDSFILASDALLWARRGEPERARAKIAEAMSVKRSISHEHHTYHYIAAALAAIGDAEGAADHLAEAIRTGMPNHVAFLKDKHFANVVTHPEFARVMDDLRPAWQELHDEFGSA